MSTEPGPITTSAAPQPVKIKSGFGTVRDLLSYIAGLAVIGHEVFFANQAEPSVIAVGVSLLGLPIVFGADERRKGPA